jgi:hypothetical protein
MVLNLSIQLVLFSTIRFVIFSPGLFMLYIFLSNFCIGGFLGTTTTLLQLVFGVKVGSAAYGVFWFVFSTSNFIQYIFVSSVASKITFDGIIYICLGMSVVALLFVIFGNFQAPWRNCPKYLGYCVRFNKSEEAVQ